MSPFRSFVPGLTLALALALPLAMPLSSSAAVTYTMEEAVNQAMTLMLTIPLEVLITDYWPKTAYKRGQEFTEKVLALYHRWEAGEVSMDELKEDLWEYGGIRLEYKEVD